MLVKPLHRGAIVFHGEKVKNCLSDAISLVNETWLSFQECARSSKVCLLKRITKLEPFWSTVAHNACSNSWSWFRGWREWDVAQNQLCAVLDREEKLVSFDLPPLVERVDDFQLVCVVIVAFRDLSATNPKREEEADIVSGSNAVCTIIVRASFVASMLLKHDSGAFDRAPGYGIDHMPGNCRRALVDGRCWNADGESKSCDPEKSRGGGLCYSACILYRCQS